LEIPTIQLFKKTIGRAGCEFNLKSGKENKERGIRMSETPWQAVAKGADCALSARSSLKSTGMHH